MHHTLDCNISHSQEFSTGLIEWLRGKGPILIVTHDHPDPCAQGGKVGPGCLNGQVESLQLQKIVEATGELDGRAGNLAGQIQRETLARK